MEKSIKTDENIQFWLTLSCSANERTEMKLKIYLSEAWMCSEFGMLITDVERERVKESYIFLNIFILSDQATSITIKRLIQRIYR